MQDYEKNLLGWVMQKPEVFAEAKRLGLTPKSFRTDKGRRLWEVFEGLSSENRDFGMIEVSDAMGDASYPIDAMETAPSAMNVKYVAEKICELEERQTYGLALERLASDSYRTDGPENWASIKTRISLLLSDIIQSNKKDETDVEYSTGVPAHLEEIEARVVAGLKNGLWGLPTGLRCLDEAFGGWQESSLYVIAARPGMGKTTLAINFTDVVARHGKHVYFCSNEMSAGQIICKHESLASGVPYDRIMSGGMNQSEQDRFFKAAIEIAKLPVTVGEQNGNFIETFEAECMARKRSGALDLAILDYCQLVSVRDRNIQLRSQELTIITTRLKRLCRSLKIPIILLAQVNRGADTNLPSLANLKDSGSIEQDADAVVFIHDDIQKGYCLFVAKNRFGKTGIMPLKTNLAGCKFYD